MNKLKIVFHAMYVAYLLISVLLFVFKQNIYNQVSDLSLLLRFTEFWVILGFFFLVSMWLVQMVNLRFLRKDKAGLIAENELLKTKLYSLDHSPTETPAKGTEAEQPS